MNAKEKPVLQAAYPVKQYIYRLGRNLNLVKNTKNIYMCMRVYKINIYLFIFIFVRGSSYRTELNSFLEARGGMDNLMR